MPDQPTSAASLLRAVGLEVDGPLPFGRPVPARGPGLFVIELPAPRSTAPLELTRVGKWLERVPELRLDGERPTSRAVANRLASFWLPSQVVLYVGATPTSVAARVAAIEKTVLGDRKPHAGGHWLQTLTVLPQTRVWWALTDAVEEYEDAVLGEFAARVPAAEAAAVPGGPAIVLPFANLRRPTGERRPTGLTGSLLPEPVVAPPPPTFVTEVPDGEADGARDEALRRARPVGGRGMGRIAQAAGYAAQGSPRRAPATPAAPKGPVPAPPPIQRPPTARERATAPATLTAHGAERLRAELDELTTRRRPEVIARIRAAKELGDLKENADYTAAREEQSFLEGRIQALEARLRNAVIVAAPAAGSRGGADLGSRLTVEVDGLTDTYTLVSTAEADPRSGRLSVESPVGRALLGAVEGADVTVQTPRGAVTYRVVSVE